MREKFQAALRKMKKEQIVVWLLLLALVIVIFWPAGSGKETASGETEESAEVRKDGGTLIAYFSWSGNTEQVAQMIQEETGGDLFENAPGATILDGLSFTESTLGNARSEVYAWLDSLELN